MLKTIVWFLRSRRRVWLLLAMIPPFVAQVAAPLEGLTPRGQSAMGIFGMAVILWVTGAVPLAVTGLLVLAALPLLHVLPAREAYSLFGNPAVFFILGAFVLAAALMQTGLSRRFSLFFLVRFGKTPRRLATGTLMVCALLSCLMPMHAVAAILFPTISTIVDALQLKPRRSRFAVLLYLSMAWGCGTGGIATLLGGARNPLAIGILYEFSGNKFDFLGWLVAALPLAVVLAAVAGVFLQWLFPPEIDDIGPAHLLLEAEVRRAGPLKRKEKEAAAVALLTVVSWIVLGQHLGMAALSLVCAFVLFALNVVSWDEVESNVNWGVFLMYGGAIALGTSLTRTGATEWVARSMLEELPNSPLLFLSATAAATFLLTEFISNAAAVAVLLPIALSTGAGIGIDPQLVTLAVAVPSGLAFTLPVGSPPNAIAFSSGYYEVRDVILAGLCMSAISYCVCVAAAWLYWPLLF